MKYADSGVDIDAAQRALADAKQSVRSTWDERVLSDVGVFGDLFRPGPGEPLLVSSVDGVGTKVKVASLVGRFDSVGQDIVNHCVDDILVQGAEPLFFLDYFATAKLEEDVLPAVIAGLAAACRENGCALLGGETAEMPGVYVPGDFDLAGCIVGRVAEEHLIDGSAIEAGDKLWGLPSSGLHTNGYTLARTVLLEKAGFAVGDTLDGMDSSVGDALLAVHRSYLADIRSLWEACGRDVVHGLAHITGGGFYDNVPRIVPAGLVARIETAAWPVPRLFSLIGELGEVSPEEMYRVFNMGIGMVVFLPAEVDPTQVAGLRAVPIGEVLAGEGARVEVVL
ncbi:MAG: phosphoribosylformylglycinamidine cyclo-ligase [bacterium]